VLIITPFFAVMCFVVTISITAAISTWSFVSKRVVLYFWAVDMAL
jgi:hypothetical protein